MMPATLLFRQEENRLAAPTEAMSAEPSPLVRATVALDDSIGVGVDGVTAIVDQAAALAESNPGSLGARARLAHAQLAAGRPDDARRTACQVVESETALQDPPTLVAAATVLASVGEAEWAERALSLLGGRSFPHLFARLAAERKEWETALQRLDGFDDATSGELRGWIQLQRHQYREAVQSFRAVIASSKVESPDLYINLGYAYGALGSLRKAIRTTKVAFAMSPTSRTAGFNLAAFYSFAGDIPAALLTLAHVRAQHPEELAPSLAIASMHAHAGDFESAERDLRQASQRTLWGSSPVERATVQANLVAVRYAQGQLTDADAYARTRKILEKSDYGDLGIARLMLWWMYSTAQADEATALVRELGRRFPRERLGAFRTQAALLHLDYDIAVEEARRWTVEEPFDLAAATTFTYLLIEAQDAFEEAVQAGRAALLRFPKDLMTRNNVACALVQLGRLDEAARVLSFAPCATDATCTATTGLLRIRQGRIDEGLAMYERAAVMAETANASLLADMIRQRATIEAEAVGRHIEVSHDIGQRHRTDPRFLLATRKSDGGPAADA